MILCIDCETTGVDFWFGARPFFVTTCTEEGRQVFWEWRVDPRTRQPHIPPEDIDAIRQMIDDADTIVGQNIKFDVTALSMLGIDNWPWHKTEDTLIASHLLSSNTPHTLDALAVQYLGKNIQPFEDRLHEATEKARRMCRSQFKDWAIARRGRRDMPSAKEKCWKFDTWLPAALANQLVYPTPRDDCDHVWGADHVCTACSGHRWWLLCSDYANADSEHTLAIWLTMVDELQARDLWELYRAGMEVAPVARSIQCHGVTTSVAKQDRVAQEFTRYSDEAHERCVDIARRRGYTLRMPAGSANNRSLIHFCFGEPDEGHTPLSDKYKNKWLDLPILSWTDTGLPSLTAEVMDTLAGMLDQGEQLDFVQSLRGKRKRDKCLSDMRTYSTFMLPTGLQGWQIIHPDLNQTGSDTLRFSHNNPNSANVKRGKDEFSLRGMFGPMPGREWWSLDYQNLELRIPAYESGEQMLIDLFEHGDEPPFYGSEHLLNFSVVYPDLWEEAAMAAGGEEKAGKWIKDNWDGSWYRRCKSGDFAIGYGSGDLTADRTFGRRGSAQKLRVRFAKKEALNQHYINFARKHGYVETLPDRTVNPRHGYPLRCTRTESGSILTTVPLNYHVQGTAMWCTRKAMVRCHKQLEQWNSPDWSGFIALQVHDELVFDLPRRGSRDAPGNLPKVRKLQRLMEESGGDIGIPLKVSVTYHDDNWGEGKSF